MMQPRLVSLMSRAEPKAVKTHCVNGHLWTPENIYTSPRGDHVCRECRRNSRRAKPPNTMLGLKRRVSRLEAELATLAESVARLTRS